MNDYTGQRHLLLGSAFDCRYELLVEELKAWKLKTRKVCPFKFGKTEKKPFQFRPKTLFSRVEVFNNNLCLPSNCAEKIFSVYLVIAVDISVKFINFTEPKRINGVGTLLVCSLIWYHCAITYSPSTYFGSTLFWPPA